MSSKDIRLRLVVRRHAVPEVKLIWPCSASEDLTIAKLLAQVDEAIPLEAGEWGLEDYAVELSDGSGGSFECLHWQLVGKLFKDDDQVIIRSLLTEDLKRRRLSGRHQISTDGKHLIDGLAFGRPWLRVPRDRPALELPPRKRARITYNDDDEDEDEDEEYDVDDEEYRPEQLLLEGPEVVETDESSLGLRVSFDDADQDDNSEADESDYGDEKDALEENTEHELEHESEHALSGTEEEISGDEGADNMGDLEEELRLLREDNALIGDDTEEPAIPSASSILDIGLTSLDDITALRAAFPLTSVTTLQNELVRQERHLRRTYETLSKSNDPAMSFDEMMDKAICGFPEFSQSALLEQEDVTFNGFDSQESADSGFKGFSPKRPLIQEVESIDEPNQEAKQRSDEYPTTDSRRSSRKVIPDSEGTSSSESSSEEDSSSESDSDESDDSDDDSDDSLSGNDNENPGDDVDEVALSSGARPYIPLEVSSDGSSSDSTGSDSESADTSEVDMNDAAKGSSEESSDQSSSSSDESDSDSEPEPEEVSSRPKFQTKAPSPPAPPPAKKPQSTVTTSNNTTIPVPPGAGMNKTQKRNARRREAKRLKALEAEGLQLLTVSDLSTEESELLARKQALLDAVSDESSQVVEKQPTAQVVEDVQPEDTPVAETVKDTVPTTADSEPRRLRVDKGASRRLLFGALGLKNPKSKADEEKLRTDLMKNVRPLKNSRIEEISEVVHTNMEEPEDPDAWRENISYRAVECCHEGIVLSEPPFPFVQRWDPQQQYGSMRKRKRNSQNFQDDNYYDDSYYDEDSQWNEDQSGNNTKKSKKRKSRGGHQDEILDRHFGKADDAENVELNYDDLPAKRPGSSQFTDMDDLPSLPADVTSLSSIDLDTLKPGMVITWKQLLMSKATNWQPQISSVTGLILSVNDDNCVDVVLAKRDRTPDDREYDAHTGKRVYDKFETPADDEEDVEDDGRRELSWTDMIDPRLVQEAPSPGLPATPLKTGMESSEINKVSEKQIRDEHVAEELDTQKVRAEVEADLREMVEKEANENLGPNPNERDPPTLTDEPLTCTSTGRDDRLNSPSRQLEETSFAAIVEKPSPKSDEQNGAEGSMDLDLDEPIILDGADADAMIPDSMPLLDIPSQQPRASNESRLTPVVDYAMLVVPSSVSSIRSGRQPPSNYELGESVDTGEDSMIPETTPRAHETAPTPHRPASPSSSKSSSPFPSIEEIFHTAATSRQTQSPLKSTQQSAIRSLKPRGKQDTEYEEEMRKLDEGDEESGQSTGRNKSIRSLFPNATQPEASIELPKLLSPKVETPTRPTRTKKEKLSPFKIPEGSQVITLSSSPTSAQFEEDYAQDSVDETYKGSPLPKGLGWVNKKNTKDVPRRETRSRGKSLPATTKPRTRRMSGSDPMVSAVSQFKGRRKTSRKF